MNPTAPWTLNCAAFAKACWISEYFIAYKQPVATGNPVLGHVMNTGLATPFLVHEWQRMRPRPDGKKSASQSTIPNGVGNGTIILIGAATGSPATKDKSQKPLILPLDEMTNVASPSYDPLNIPMPHVVWIKSAAVAACGDTTIPLPAIRNNKRSVLDV